jgi:hypothetical protein
MTCEKKLLKNSKFVFMYSNSLAQHFSPMSHTKCLLPRLDRLLPVRSCLKYFYQCNVLIPLKFSFLWLILEVKRLWGPLVTVEGSKDQNNAYVVSEWPFSFHDSLSCSMFKNRMEPRFIHILTRPLRKHCWAE